MSKVIVIVLIIGSVINNQILGAELKRDPCLLKAIVNYNECHKNAGAFLDVHKGRLIIEEESIDMKHTETCMLEAFKIICISIEARKCKKEDNSKILDTVKQVTFLRFYHCSADEIVDLSTRIIEYVKENDINVTDQKNDNDKYEFV